jgi:hypothetical protein
MCMIIYMHIHMYTHSDRENKIVLVSLSDGATIGRRKKMLENEKYWNNPSIYNIMQCTVQ